MAYYYNLLLRAVLTESCSDGGRTRRNRYWFLDCRYDRPCKLCPRLKRGHLDEIQHAEHDWPVLSLLGNPVLLQLVQPYQLIHTQRNIPQFFAKLSATPRLALAAVLFMLRLHRRVRTTRVKALAGTINSAGQY